MGGVREDRHVHPDLGDDALGRPLADPSDRVEVVTGAFERGDHPVDLGAQLVDRVLELLDVRKREPDQQGVVGGEATVERLAQLGQLRPQPASGEFGERLRVPLAGHERGEHRPTGGAEHGRGDRVEPDAGVFEGLADPLGRGVPQRGHSSLTSSFQLPGRRASFGHVAILAAAGMDFTIWPGQALGLELSKWLDRWPETKSLAELRAYLSQRVGHEGSAGPVLEQLRLLDDKHEVRLGNRVRPQASVRATNENVVPALILGLGAAENDDDRRVQRIPAVSPARDDDHPSALSRRRVRLVRSLGRIRQARGDLEDGAWLNHSAVAVASALSRRSRTRSSSRRLKIARL